MIVAMPNLRKSARHGRNLETSPFRGFGEVSSARHQPQSCANPPIAGTGTGVAIIFLTSGVAPHLPRSTVWGGARNRASRESHALTSAQIANLKAAERHARVIGLPFTRMLTIHWQAAGVPLAGMAKATGRFLDCLTRWLARKGHRTAWLWVHEGGEAKGGHCHLLAHVPADLVAELTGNLRRWLGRITGQPYRARVIHSKPIGGRLGLEASNADLHAVNLEVAFGYACKGARQEVLDAFGIEREHEPGGRVIGKRCGTSQNIGAKARKAKD